MQYTITVRDDGTASMKRFDGASKSATSTMDKFKGAASVAAKSAAILSGVAIGAGASMFALAKKTAETEDRVGKLSQRIGFSTESISAYGHAAQLSGISTDVFERSLDHMNTRLGEARDGSGKAADAYAELSEATGIAIDLTADNETILRQTADAMQQIDDPSKKAALAVDIFGRSGREMVGVLQNGSEGLDEMRANADKFGATISSNAAKNSAAFNDRLLELRTTIAGVTRESAGEFIPQITDVMADLSETVLENKQVFIDFGTALGASIKAVTPMLQSTLRAVSWVAKELTATMTVLSAGVRQAQEDQLDALTKTMVHEARMIRMLQDEQAQFAKGSEEYEYRAQVIKELAAVGEDAAMQMQALGDPVAGAKFLEFFEKFTDQKAPEVKQKIQEIKTELKNIADDDPLPDIGIFPSEEDFLNNRTRLIADTLSLHEELSFIRDHGIDNDLAREEQAYQQKRQMILDSASFVSGTQEMLDMLDEQYNNKQVERARATEQAKRMMVADTMQNANNLMKGVFGKNQAFALADVAMSTYRGIMSAMADPIMPFPMKVFNAGIVGAMGLTQATKIKSQKFITGGIVSQRGQMIQVAEDGNPESVINATGTRILGQQGVSALNQGRASDLLNMIAENTGRSSGGTTINITSTMIDKRFLEDTLMPAMNKLARRF